ncbi:MAG: 30S ribosomal protein S4e [Methanocalculaceae archaeon]|jgi:small subunit ribosomal protein S4e|nr:30S ribosomal protein S4e [Methanocalculaceae archaeon]
MTRTKRITAPNAWRIARKESKYVVSTAHGPHNACALPIGIWIRDHMHFAQNIKEVKKILHDRNVVLNGNVVTDEHIGIDVFDIISFPKIAKHYMIFVDAKGRHTEYEISADAAKIQLVKIANKITLTGGKTQINLTTGANFIGDNSYKGKDSLVIGLVDDNRFVVQQHFSFAIGNTAVVIGGQHTMKTGKITEILIQQSSLPNRVILEGVNGEKFETIEDYVYMIGTSESFLSTWGVDA